MIGARCNMIFASNGFGAAADGTAIACIASIGLLVAVIVGLVGNKLTKSKRKLIELVGVIMLVLGCALPFVVCSSLGGDPERMESRRKVKKGMTKQEVVKTIGEPGRKNGKDWVYYTGFWGNSFFIVIFGEDGRVDRTFID
jgi:hypothetical protein